MKWGEKKRTWVKMILLKTISAIAKRMNSSGGRVPSSKPVGLGALKLSIQLNSEFSCKTQEDSECTGEKTDSTLLLGHL